MRVSALPLALAALLVAQVAGYAGWHPHKNHKTSGKHALRGPVHLTLLEENIKSGHFTANVLKEMATDSKSRRIVAYADSVDSLVSRAESYIMEVSHALEGASNELSNALEGSANAKGHSKHHSRHHAKHHATPKPAAHVNGTTNKTTIKHEMSASGRAALEKEKSVLAGLMSKMKSNIMNFNKEEKKGKAEEDKMLEHIKERLAKGQAELKNPKLSAFEHAALVNQTTSEQLEVKYWTQGRDIQHSMFHSNLKMTHGLMSRVQTVIKAYQDALAHGKLDPKTLKDVKAISAQKSFIEMTESLRTEATDYITHIKKAAELLAEPID